MLEHMGEMEAATNVRDALMEVLKEGDRVTRDLNPQAGVSTTEMTEAIIGNLESTRCL
jgi:isocitrate/isopropylmalate dehydrogenase